MELSVVFLGGWWLSLISFVEEEYNARVKITILNFWMVMLVFVMFLMIVMIENRIKLRLNFLLLILVWLIKVSDFFVFFFIYEIIFILIIFVILILGYRYERLIAGYLIIFYSFLFSRPMLIIVLLFDHTFLMKAWLNYRIIVNYFFVGSFMVKFPIFGFHYWLPVAHVEASTVGSILLAGILLKIGSVGLIYRILYINFIIKFHWLVLGVCVVILMILVLSDLKIIIAYSSVAHITLVFYIMNLGWDVGLKGAIIIIFYHGFLSPLIFWVVGILRWWKTRSLMVVKLIIFSYRFILVWFLVMILNIRFPPFIGFIREILMLKSAYIYNIIMWVVIFSVLFRCYYNIYLFWVFNGVKGWIFKLNLINFDLFIFLIWRVFLVFF